VIVQSILQSVGDVKDKVVVVALDRLEILRGVYWKLLAWERLLQEHPEWRGKICLIQVVTASAEEVKAAETYKKLMHVEDEIDVCRRDIKGLASRINEKFSVGKQHVVHIIEKEKLCLLDRLALWTIGKIFMSTPLREGLNLFPFEFLVVHDECRKIVGPWSKYSRTPTLILSEFSAASRVLTGR
jgi:trehalose 6-phosphate synthase/phosphatase